MTSTPLPAARTIVDLLKWRAAAHGSQVACTFLVDGEREEATLTYAGLDGRARTVAAHLSRVAAPGDRVALVLPSGLDYLAAFFGCLYAGCIAVPFYPPRRRTRAHLDAVVNDAGVAIAVGTLDACSALAAGEGGRRLRTIPIERLGEDDGGIERVVGSDDVAYLQYTSGSTRRPRGVVVQHGQLLRHAALVWQGLEQDEASIVFSWLPLFHDMGLVGSIVAPLAFGRRIVLMSPWHFMARPARWLAGISRHRATTSGAPNSAYDLCVARIGDEERGALDLRCWRTAFNGAEPVHASTLDRFAGRFEPNGFSIEAFRPCYGLAEATLLVTASSRAVRPTIVRVSRQALERGRVEPAVSPGESAAEFVGCGSPAGDQRVLIVDPGSRTVLHERAIGEIWVSGSSAASRYWAADGERPVFGAATASGDGPYVRTGDLGFIEGGQLCVTGRLKDLLIVHGRNYYPADLEEAIRGADASLAGSLVAAFTSADESTVVALFEAPRTLDRAAVRGLVAKVRGALASEFGFRAMVVPIRFGGLPRTSSGKIMGAFTKERFAAGELPVVEVGEPSPMDRPSPSRSHTAALEAIRRSIASILEVSPAAIDVGCTFAECGLGSLQIAELAERLERELGVRFETDTFFSYPTPSALAAHLAAGRSEDTSATAAAAGEGVAIVGLACRFPGALDAEAFWDLLQHGRDAIAEVPADRWSAEARYERSVTRSGTTNTKWGGFLPRVDLFDREFFGISDAEARDLDPQQRLLLETAVDALDDAGIALDSVKGTHAGVFVGISTNDYARTAEADERASSLFWCTGAAFSMAANRISFALDLRGPSLAIDTACSSSLAALHLACRSLRSGESEIALAGGVNVILSDDISVAMSQAGATSASGRCKSFDASADGLVRGEGVGVVVLKPLGRALADADRIYAVVKGTAVNQDGATNGLTAPNPRAQAEVVRAAYEDAGVPPGSVQYVEAHGAGTPLGDPLELTALASVVAGPSRTDVCRVASVKTNIGHLEAAAGIAGVIKTALALLHGQIPPSLHFDTPNPRIPFDELKLAVPTTLEEWPARNGAPRRAGVSAFGFGGTNVHAVLEAAPAPSVARAAASPIEPYQVLRLSARGRPALKATAKAYCDYLAAPDRSIRDVTGALARRSSHRHRLAIVGQSAADIVHRLEGFLNDDPDRLVFWGEAPSGSLAGPTFAFSGFEIVSRDRFEELMVHAAFRGSVERCETIARRIAGTEVGVLPARGADTADPRAALIRDQLCLFSLQVSVAALWRSWGVEPVAVVGHSVGEIAAAHVAGALELEGALEVVYHRSRLLAEHLAGHAGRGAMVAVALPAADAREHLRRFDGPLEIAAENSPTLTVVAGERAVLDRFVAGLTATGVVARTLKIPGPGHSSFVEDLQQPLADSLAALEPRASRVPFFSSATGASRDGERLDRDHWARHLRAPVSFVDAVGDAIRSGHRLFLEIGVEGALSPCIAGVMRDRSVRGFAIPSCSAGIPANEAVAAAAAQLFVGGVPVNWGRSDEAIPWIPLPSYPWQHSRYWRSPSDSTRSSSRPGTFASRLARSLERVTPHPFLGVRLPGPESIACWRREVDADVAWLRDHRIGGVAVVPATAYVALAVEAVRETTGEQTMVLEDVRFERALFVPDRERRILQTTIESADSGERRLTVHGAGGDGSDDADGWIRLASARIRTSDARPPRDRVALDDLRAARDIGDPRALYEAFARHGIAYGPSFTKVDALWLGDDYALARVATGESRAASFDPSVLDACLQPLAATVMNRETSVAGSRSGPALLPTRIRRLSVAGDLQPRLWSRAVGRRSPAAPEAFEGDVTIMDDDGRVLVSVEGFAVEPIGREAPIVPLAVSWHPREPEPTVDRRSGRWLVVGQHAGVADELVTILRDAGIDARLIDGDVNLRDEIDGGARVAGIVDLRPSIATRVDGDGTRLANVVARACGGALDAMRAAAGCEAPDPPLLWVVTRRGVAVDADEVASPWQHPLWALARTASIEEPRVWGGIVDLDPQATDRQNAAHLFATLIEADDEDQIAWRGGRRYVARLAPAPQEVGRAAAPPVRASGTYLVTGGLGELGFEVASWLVEQGARRLVLLGRTPLPPREMWCDLEDDRLRRAAQMILALERRGASVHVAAVDISAAGELSAWLDRFRREAWPDIAGVMHLAGVVRPGPLQEVTDATLEEHFAAKIAGAWNLHRYFEHVPLDFFVLFSSGSALLGSPGIGAYAAANGFLDALAAVRRAAGLPALSIAWGFWSETGMAARLLRTSPDRPAPRGLRGLTNRTALEMLGRLMASRAVSVGIMPFDWDDWAEAHPVTAGRRYLRLLTTARADVVDGVGITRDDVLAAPAGERAAIVEQYLRARLARILQVDPDAITRDDPLSQLGIDSLMAVELKNRVEADLRISVPIVALLQGGSVAQLARVVLEALLGPTAATGDGTRRSTLETLDADHARALLARLDELPAATIASWIDDLAAPGGPADGP